MSTPVKIVFAGGGTGGHLFPALAIAQRLQSMVTESYEPEFIFVGTRRGLEYRLRDSLGYPLRIINIRGLARSFSVKNLMLPVIVLLALIKSYLLLKRFEPDLIVGTGGYVCWPILKAASVRGIPMVLQEQNSYPGIATRQMARYAERIYLGFERAKEHLQTDAPIMLTGNPVRSSVLHGNREEALQEFGLEPDRKTVLILGGSQGARRVNNAILESLQRRELPDDIQILWQTGTRDYKDVAAAAGSKVIHGSLFPFSERMDLVYAASDLAIARAGAITIAELTACGVPSILIPLPGAAGDHQRKNAREMAVAGVSVIIEEAELREQDPVQRAVQIIRADEFDRMRHATMSMARDAEPAVDRIARDIMELIRARKYTGEGIERSS